MQPSPLVGLPSDLPDGVQEQVDLFLSDYPRTGPELVRCYLQLVMSEKYRFCPMERSENQLVESDRTKKNKPKTNRKKR